MLHEKDHVKAKTENSKEQLCWITSDSTPIRLHCAVDDQLKKRHDSADEVQPDHIDGPACGRFDLVVVPIG